MVERPETEAMMLVHGDAVGPRVPGPKIPPS
jgi:hypothetical protein